MFKITDKINLIAFIFLSAIIIFTFWSLPLTFYQQDEWQALGHYLAEGTGAFLNHTNPIRLFFAGGRPLGLIFIPFFYGAFSFSLEWVTIIAIMFHIVNSFLAFFLTRKIFKKELIAFLAAVFFAVNSVSHQGVTWAGATAHTVLPSTFFILLSILFYQSFLLSKDKKKLYLSFLFTVVALFFKEVGTVLFILLPIMYCIHNKKFKFKQVLKLHFPFLLYAAFFVFYRIFFIFTRTEIVTGQVQANNNFFQTVFLRLILYPLTSIFQIFVPPLSLYSITQPLTRMQYKFLVGSPYVDLIAQSVTADMVSILGAVIFLIVLIVLHMRMKSKDQKTGIIFALIFFVFSFLPYAIINRDSSYLSSRYFYVGAIPAGMLLGILVYYFISFFKTAKWIVLILITLFLFKHAFIIRYDIDYQVKLAESRLALLRGIKNIYPNLDNNTIFYITSDKKYYGEITNPFQNGLGYVLEIWYYDSGKIPSQFLSENFLWDLGAEGYKQSGDKGFGYFQNIDKMAKVIQEKKLSNNIIHGYFFDSKTLKVKDITIEITEKVATFSAYKQ